MKEASSNGKKEASKETSSWPEDKRWILGILASILASIVVSGIVGFFSARYALEGRIREGQAVLTNVGWRYFEALLLAHNINQEGVGVPSKTRNRWDAYRKTLGNIEEDIRWLRTNPLSDRITSEVEDLAFLQNQLVREITEDDDCSANRDTLSTMCVLFIESGELKKAISESGISSTIHDFAVLNCQKMPSPNEIIGRMLREQTFIQCEP